MTKKLFLSLSLLLFAASFAQAQSTECYRTGPNPRTGTGCICKLIWGSGDCICTSNGSLCHTEGGCPYNCLGGAIVTQAQLTLVKEAVSAHKSMITVFLGKACYEGAIGRAFIEEATRQGKAVRFVVTPTFKNAQEVDEYNHKLEILQDALAKQEKAADDVKVQE